MKINFLKTVLGACIVIIGEKFQSSGFIGGTLLMMIGIALVFNSFMENY